MEEVESDEEEMDDEKRVKIEGRGYCFIGESSGRNSASVMSIDIEDDDVVELEMDGPDKGTDST